MRWTIIRLIFYRELRDQLRDRRTIFMIVVLPLLLYPLLGVGVLQFAVGLVEKPLVIGIAGSQYLPALTPQSGGFSPLPAIAALAVTPAGPGAPGSGLDQLLGAAALMQAVCRQYDYPPLLIENQFPAAYLGASLPSQVFQVKLLNSDSRAPLDDKEVDLILLVPSDFRSLLEEGGRPTLRLAHRENDDVSRQADGRLRGVLRRWQQYVRDVRLIRSGLPPHFNDPIAIQDADPSKAAEEVASEGLVDLLVRIFPFLLVMWSLAGALVSGRRSLRRREGTRHDGDAAHQPGEPRRDRLGQIPDDLVAQWRDGFAQPGQHGHHRGQVRQPVAEWRPARWRPSPGACCWCCPCRPSLVPSPWRSGPMPAAPRRASIT